MRNLVVFLFALVLIFVPKAGPAAMDSPTPPGPWQHPPQLDKPTGRVVEVRTEAQLQAAVRNLKSDVTILIAPGTYNLTNTLNVQGNVKNVALRGAAPERGKVVLKGRGMANKDYGGVPHGIMVSDATDVLIANLSVGDVWFHPITLQGQLGCKRVRICNVRLFDAGEQFLKANPDGKGGGADDCTVEYCVFEYVRTARHNYTQGMSVHTCANWVVRNNLFRNIRGPKGDAKVGGCIDFWHGSKNATVEGNVMVNCRMGIRLGLMKKQDGHDNEGGIVRNNVFWRQPGAVEEPDAGIIVADSPGTKVLHNTILLNGTYSGGAIEYRWCKDALIANNLTDGKVWKREEADGEEKGNVVLSDPKALFVNSAAGDLHLSARGVGSLRKVARREDCLTDFDGNKRSEKTDVGADEFAKRR
jgi:hypothetical protein